MCSNKMNCPDDSDMDDEALDELLSCLVFQMGTANTRFVKRNVTEESIYKAATTKSSSETKERVSSNDGETNDVLGQDDCYLDDEALFWTHYQPSVRRRRRSCMKAEHDHSSWVMQPSKSESSLYSTNHDDSIQGEKREARVRFDRVEVREYYVEPGEHPCCKAGPALTLGWDYVTVLRRSVSHFEAFRVVSRRDIQDLFIPVEEREQILKRSGFSDADISETVELMAKERVRRMKTLLYLKKYGRFDETLQKARSKFLRLLNLQKNDEAMMNELWHHAVADYYEEFCGTSRCKTPASRFQRRTSFASPGA